MKRPIAALLLTIFLFSGVYAYTSFVRGISREPLQIQEDFSSEVYSARVTRTCDLIGADGFDEIYSLHVTFRGTDLIARKNSVPSTEKLEDTELTGVTNTGNEIYVSANLDVGDDQWADDWGEKDDAESPEKLGAIRVEVFRGESRIADKTFWQESGSTNISDSISFKGSATQQNHEH